MVLFLKLESPFTCNKIQINRDASQWNFKCNAVLDKHEKKMIMTLKDPMEVKLTIEQSQDPKGFSGGFPLAVKFKGKSGESNYQLVDDF